MINSLYANNIIYKIKKQASRKALGTKTRLQKHNDAILK